jgi:hypothetical protein
MRVKGYCALCRAKEIELYGNVLGTTGKRHERACREAGCRHPAVYVWGRQRSAQASAIGDATGRLRRRRRQSSDG